MRINILDYNKKINMGLLFLKRFFLWMFLFGFSFGLPSIVEQPIDKEVLQGEDVTLRCVVDQIPQDVQDPVQWTKGNFGLGNDLKNWERYSMIGDVTKGEYHLEIRNANVSVDDNKYECQVTSYELRSRQAKLTVLVPPTGPFIDDARDDGDTVSVDVVVGEENEIRCHALNGKPAATLTWFKGEKEIYEDVESVVSSPVNKLYNVSSTLRIKPDSNDGDVTYACVMSGVAMKESKRTTVKLNLLEPPKVSVFMPDTIREGDYIEALCRSYADPPVSSYRWYLDDILQPEETTSVFILGVINKTWHGTSIGCEARNAAGYSKRNIRTFDVLYPPVFLGGTDKIIADIGQNVTLRCNWDSNPNPLIQWFHEGNNVELSQDPELHLQNVDQIDSGKYHCSATAGQVGDNEATTELIVYGPPIFNHENIQHAMLGEDAEIRCSLGSYPGIQHVTWSWKDSDRDVSLRDNETRQSPEGSGENKFLAEFEDGRRFAKLRVIKASNDDLHSYKCTVENSYGVATTDIELQEDTTRAQQIFTMSATIGIASGIAILAVALLLLGWCCVRNKRQQKSTNFDKVNKQSMQHSTEMDKQRAFETDETIAISHKNEINSGAYNVRSHSVSSHGAGGSSVSESDGVNPTPQSGQDDGYHTEEASSWNRNHEHPDKNEAESARHKNSHLNMDYVVDLPPVPESVDFKQPLLNEEHLENDQYPPRPMSANRYPYEQPGLSHAPSYRSASALAGRYSPAVGFDSRYPDNIPASMYAQPQVEYYPPNPVYTTLQPIVEPMVMFGNSPYPSRPRLTPVPISMAGFDQYDQIASQSSLNNYETESALSSSIIPTRTVDRYDNNGRNLHSRLSQSSKSSEFSKPLVARMATHV